MKREIVNIAAYKFVKLEASALDDLRERLMQACVKLKLKGTILLSTEGINLVLAGSVQSIEEIKAVLDTTPKLDRLAFKESGSNDQPFERMLVKIKKEIIPFGVVEVNPADQPAPVISPAELKQRLEQGDEIILLDTRNQFEYELGTFKNAISLNLKNFREFPEAAKKLPSELKHKPIVTFCTGGIRCEKAAPLLINYGFTNVFQLDGGILKYFEENGSAHFQGECFVFDQRIALDGQLKETPAAQSSS